MGGSLMAEIGTPLEVTHARNRHTRRDSPTLGGRLLGYMKSTTGMQPCLSIGHLGRLFKQGFCFVDVSHFEQGLGLVGLYQALAYP